MKRIFIVIAVSVMTFAFTGCGIYNKYTSSSEISSDASGTSEDVTAAQAESSIAELSWREFFTDPLLQQLIDSVLQRNTDAKSARIAVEQAEISLRATKLGYLPSVTFAPSVGVNSYLSEGSLVPTLTYSLPLQINWDLDIFAVNTNQEARAAFYPKISLQGILSWGNNSGMIPNPGSLLLNALASVVQPIFAQGKLKANLKINQLSEEDIAQQYVQTVINAGNQVNEALADCQAAQEKDVYYKRQVEVLQEAYMGTHELMDNGKASYSEVLSAQEGLLSAQISEATNLYNGARALIAIYIAFGGGTK